MFCEELREDEEEVKPFSIENGFNLLVRKNGFREFDMMKNRPKISKIHYSFLNQQK